MYIESSWELTPRNNLNLRIHEKVYSFDSYYTLTFLLFSISKDP